MLDNLICGHEVDTKFSLSGNWMIPREAIDQLCLVVEGSDQSGIFSVGLLRATDATLTVGANQDFKRSISAAGKRQVRWLIQGAKLPVNFMLTLDHGTRSAILAPTSGVQRMTALFTLVTGKIIPRTAILQVGQQSDSAKRARELKAPLLAKGFKILCARYLEDRTEMLRYGFLPTRNDEWVSIKL